MKRQLEEQGFNADLVKNTIGAETPWNYRNKMEFTFSPEGNMGLHEQGNFRKVFDMKTC